jgi:Flp pilus assembly protein TadG
MFKLVFKRLQCDESGTIAAIAGISMTVIIACVGAGVDYGRALNQQSELQRAIDAAVLAGGATDNIENRVAVATDYFTANFNGKLANPVTPTFTSTATKLTGTVAGSVSTTLTAVVGIDSIPIAATATVEPTHYSTTIPGALPCFLALDPAKSGALTLISTNDLSAPECEMHVRSTANDAFIYKSPEGVNFKSIEVKGKAVKQSGSTIARINAPSSRVGDDPFIGLMPTVTPDACTTANTNLTLTGTVNPGTYCGVTTFGNPPTTAKPLGGGGTVTLNPGLYVFKSNSPGGGLKVTAQYFRGHGVTFYFDDNNTTLLKYASKNDNHLHAPHTGTYAGILMFEKVGLAKKTVTIDSADEQSWQGLVYLPSWDLRLISISKWPNTKLSEQPAWPPKGSPMLLLDESPVTPSMNVAIVVNSLYSDSLSVFHHTPFAWGDPVVRLPGAVISKLTTNLGSMTD